MSQGPNSPSGRTNPQSKTPQSQTPTAPGSGAQSGTPGIPTTQTSPTTPSGSIGGSGGDITNQAQQTASHVVSRASNVVSSRIEAQKDRAVGGLGSVADALRQTSRNIAQNDAVGIHQYVDAAANQVERVSRYLDQNGVGDIVEDVEDFARRRPAIFYGGAFVLGLLGVRFLRSSRPQPFEHRRPASTRATRIAGSQTRTYGRQNYPPPTATPGGRYAPQAGYGAGSPYTPHTSAPGTGERISPDRGVPGQHQPDLTPGIPPAGDREGR